MAGLHLLLHLILILVCVVVGLHIGVRNLRLAARQIGRIEGDILNLASLGNRRRIARGVALEEGLQVGVRRVDALAHVVC